MELTNPRCVVLLGDTARKRVFPEASLGRVHGTVMTQGERSYFPTYHPAAIIYNPSLKGVLEGDFERLGTLLRRPSSTS
jgi:uracil-DNA glycosylase